jgi:3-hydroxyisobutyrate dehydrogenase
MTGRGAIVTVLGIGTMGAPIARSLLRAGFEVRVWNRSPAKASALVADGARQASTPAEAASGANIVITMLTDGAAVERVMHGPKGALAVLTAGAVWIQMSTVGVESTDRLTHLADRHGVVFVDAPVSGSSAAAEQGHLVVLASSGQAVRPVVEPIFNALGKQTLWLPHVGDGSRIKLALNNWLGVLVEGMAESLTLAQALGIDPQLLLEAMADGPMASEYAINKGAAMLSADFVPGFPLRHAAKDVELALTAAHRHGVELPLTDALLPRWQQTIAADHGDDDIASVVTAAAITAPPPGERLIVSTS